MKETEVDDGRLKSVEEKSFIFTSEDVKNSKGGKRKSTVMNVDAEFTSRQHIEDVCIVLFV